MDYEYKTHILLADNFLDRYVPNKNPCVDLFSSRFSSITFLTISLKQSTTDLLFPHHDRERLEFKDSATKIGFDELTAVSFSGLNLSSQIL